MAYVPPKWFWVLLQNLDPSKIPPELMRQVATLGFEALKANLTLAQAEKLYNAAKDYAQQVLEQGRRQVEESIARRPRWMQ